MTDRISLTIPADERFRSVSALVVGGVGTRLDLSYERMDDLQLALLSVLEAIDGDEAALDIAADESELSVTVGPLRAGSTGDAGLLRVVERLVDGHDVQHRDGHEWLTVHLSRPEKLAG